MIVGHVGIAYWARTKSPAASLPWLLAASIMPDLIDGVLSRMRVLNPCSVYSHSIPAVVVLALLVSGCAYVVTGSWRGAALVAALVVAHLPADYVTGLKVLWPNGPVVGFYLYRWPVWDFVIEVPIVGMGWLMLRRSASAPRWAISGLSLGVLILVQGALDLRKIESGTKKISLCEASAMSP